MLLVRLLELAVQGLLRRRLRSSFTLGSVVVGTAGLLLFFSVAYGLDQQLQAQLGGYEPATVLHVDPPLAAPSTSALGGPPPGIDETLLARLRALPHVRNVFAEVQVGGNVTIAGTDNPLELRPVPPSYLSAGADVHLLAGRLLSAANAHDLVLTAGFVHALTAAPLVGSAAAGALAARATPGPAPATPTIAGLVGQTVRFTPQQGPDSQGTPQDFRVVGIIDGRAPFAYVPYQTGLALLPPQPNGSSPTYDAAVIEVERVEDVAAVRQEVAAEHLHIETTDTLAKSLTGALGVARVVAAIIALVGLLLAVINISNMLLAAVTERAREIGIMKAVGARNWHVGTLFLLESLLLGLLGAAGGSAIAILLARVVLRQFPLQLADGPPLVFAFPALYVALTIVAVTALSALAGLVPALRAARVDPAAAIAGAR